MIVTLLTDFEDLYLAAMKGVILSINPSVNIVDLGKVRRHDIVQGAFLLRSLVRFFPSAIHLGVVDPGVGTARKPLIIEAGSSYLVGPDNGLLIPAAQEFGSFRIYEITRRFESVSPTFHGRDIFARVAGMLSVGTKPAQLGVPISNYTSLDLWNYSIEGDIIECSVVFVDSFGNLVTNLRARDLRLSSGQLISLQGKLIPFVRTYAEVPPGQPLALIGSHGTLEIALNQGDAARYFGVDQGQRILLKLVR